MPPYVILHLFLENIGSVPLKSCLLTCQDPLLKNNST